MEELRNSYKILVGNLKGRDHFEEWISGKHMTQIRDQWRAVVNTAMNLRVK
jgi:hypothetical protein